MTTITKRIFCIVISFTFIAVNFNITALSETNSDTAAYINNALPQNFSKITTAYSMSEFDTSDYSTPKSGWVDYMFYPSSATWQISDTVGNPGRCLRFGGFDNSDNTTGYFALKSVYDRYAPNDGGTIHELSFDVKSTNGGSVLFYFCKSEYSRLQAGLRIDDSKMTSIADNTKNYGTLTKDMWYNVKFVYNAETDDMYTLIDNKVVDCEKYGLNGVFHSVYFDQSNYSEVFTDNIVYSIKTPTLSEDEEPLPEIFAVKKVTVDSAKKFKAEIINNTGEKKSVVMIVAGIDNFGAMTSVQYSPTTMVDSEGAEITVQTDDKNAAGFRVMFIKDWTSLAPVDVDVYRVYEDKNLTVDIDFENKEIGDIFMNGKTVYRHNEKMLEITANKEAQLLTFDSFILGDFAISFDIESKGGVCGEFAVQGGGTPAYVLVLEEDGKIKTKETGELVADCSIGTVNIAVAYHTLSHTFDIYANGKLMCKNYSADKSGIEVTFDKCVTFSHEFTSASDEDSRVYLDNILSYSTAIKNSKGFIYDPDAYVPQWDKEIVITGQTYIPGEENEKRFLEDKASLHMRSGVTYSEGKKGKLSVLPFESDGEFMVPDEFFENVLGLEISNDGDVCIVGDNIKIESNKMNVNGTVYDIHPPQAKDGVLYLPLKAILQNGLGKYIYYDNTCVHSGMIIVAEKEFSPLSGEALQALNDFCFFERPDSNRFLADYKASTLCGAHPRVMADSDDFERIIYETQTNSRKKAWLSQLENYCRRIKSEETLKYEFRDGVRLLFVAADFQNYMLALSMAYRLTGNREYFEIAWPHLKAAATMPDWNPSHHIDVGVMALGYAIAYDWFYDVMTENQRQIVEKGAKNNCLWIVNRATEDENTEYTSVLKENNHNVYSNAGVMAMCIAFMDVYPDICSKLGADVMRIVEYFMDKFAPLGAYYEGPYYAETAIDYTVRLFASMYPTMGTLYSVDKAQGFDMAGEYMAFTQSDVSAFNFADSQFGLFPTSSLFWAYSYYKIKGLKEAHADASFSPADDDTIAYALLWYDVKEEDKSEDSVPLDVHYKDNEIITMRNAYKKNQVFVGIKAGKTDYAHSHLDAGSFVFDANGKRWAFDLGQDDYNLEYKYDKWDIFRRRAESHNVLLINPDASPGFVVGSEAPVTSFESSDDAVIVKIDTTALYGKNVKKAQRGFFFTDSRSSLVVRDEVSLTGESNLYWLMYTDAKAQINGNTAILTNRRNQSDSIKVEFVSSHPGEIGFEAAKPFPGSPSIPEQNPNTGFYRLFYKVKADGNADITAKITPLNTNNVSDLTDYNTPVDKWQLK